MSAFRVWSLALIVLVAGAIGFAVPADAASPSDPVAAAPPQRLAWWNDARFGMFIHWGLYSQWGCHYPGPDGTMTNGGSAHMMLRLKIPLARYAKIADVFDPTNFNAEEWVRIAKDAGMRYMVFTSKHHDGFAMFDSPCNDYNIVARTPWHRDPVKELAEACRRQGLKFGVYYSLGRDWADPDVPTLNKKTGERGYRSNTWDFPDETNKVFARYFERKVVPQVTELLTQYGPIAVLWFDTPEEISKAESHQLVDLVHKLQPQCIINSRVGHGFGDYGVQEQKIPGNGEVKLWETCMTLNRHWAYFKGDNQWKSPATVVRDLVDVASKGGNFLLDVGPTGLGLIQPEAVAVLKQVGVWLKVNGESVYGTKSCGALKTQPSWGRVTQRGDRIYLHVFDWPKDSKLVVPDIAPQQPALSAHLLADEKRTPLKTNRDRSSHVVTVTLPPAPVDPIDTVVVLHL